MKLLNVLRFQDTDFFFNEVANGSQKVTKLSLNSWSMTLSMAKHINKNFNERSKASDSGDPQHIYAHLLKEFW